MNRKVICIIFVTLLVGVGYSSIGFGEINGNEKLYRLDSIGNITINKTKNKINKMNHDQTCIDAICIQVEFERIDNYYEIQINIENRDFYSRDFVWIDINIDHFGFQCCNQIIESYIDNPTDSSSRLIDPEIFKSIYIDTLKGSRLQINYSNPKSGGGFQPILSHEENLFFKYQVVPILFPKKENEEEYEYRIAKEIKIDYGIKSTPKNKKYTASINDQVWEEPDLNTEEAFGIANYLLVTNPNNLFIINGDSDDVHELLSMMAELAMNKSGVLGYLYTPVSFYGNYKKTKGYNQLVCGDLDADYYDELLISGDNNSVTFLDYYNKYYKNYEDFDFINLHFDPGDALACGDVDDDGEDEIFMAKDDSDIEGEDTLIIFNDPAPREYVFETSYDTGDGFVCGDIIDDDRDEIIIGNANEIWGDNTQLVSIDSELSIENFDMFVDDKRGVHIVWADETNYGSDGLGSDIYYSYRISNGLVWDKPLLISKDCEGDSRSPCITVDPSGIIHIVWSESTSNFLNSGDDWDIVYRSGKTNQWNDIELISSESNGDSLDPTIAVGDDGKVFVAWEDLSHYIDNGGIVNLCGDDIDIFYKSKTIDPSPGIWGNTELVSPHPLSNEDSYDPDIFVLGTDTVYIVWVDCSNYAGYGNDPDIWYRSRDFNWDPNPQVVSSESTLSSLKPSITVNNLGEIHVVWHDNTPIQNCDSDYDIFYKYKSSRSIGWSKGQFETIVLSENCNENSLNPSISTSGDEAIYVAWQDSTNFKGCGYDNDIFYKKKDQFGIWSSIDVVTTQSDTSSRNPCLSIDSIKTTHLSWIDSINDDLWGSDDDVVYEQILSENHIDYYTVNKPHWPYRNIKNDIWFNDGDLLAVGYIDSGKEDIVIVREDFHPTGEKCTMIDIYFNSFTDHKIFEREPFDFNPEFDIVVCGDVDGDYLDEIIITDKLDNVIYIYDYYLSFSGNYVFESTELSYPFQRSDILLCCDVNYMEEEYFPIMKDDEIIIVGGEDGVVNIIDLYDGSIDEWFKLPFPPLDVFSGHIITYCKDYMKTGGEGEGIISVTTEKFDKYIKNKLSYYWGYSNTKLFDIPIFHYYGKYICGDVDNDGMDEIIFANSENHKIHITYDGGPWKHIPDSEFTYEPDFQIECGDIDCNFIPDIDINLYGLGRDELLVGRPDEKTIEIYSTWCTTKHIMPSEEIDFQKGSSLNCGDTDGDGEDEIIVSKPHKDHIKIYHDIYGEKYENIAESSSYVDCMKVNGDNLDEIILIDNDKLKIFTRSAFGDFLCIPEGNIWLGNYHLDESNYRLVTCGNFHGNYLEELIVGYRNNQMIEVWEPIKIVPNNNLRDDSHRLLLDDLIEDGGYWEEQINKLDGNELVYLLIVGETEIIPAGVKHYDISRGSGWVRITDLPYADSGGDLHKPELINGRIIGYRAEDLIKPINWSLQEWRDVNRRFKFEKALLYSGYCKGKSKSGDHVIFYEYAFKVHERLEKNGISRKDIFWVHCDHGFSPNIFVPGIKGSKSGVSRKGQIDDYTDNGKEILRFSYQDKDGNAIPTRDIIYLTAHGNINMLDQINEIYTHDVQGHWIDRTHPMVFASACLTGRYVENINGEGLAEYFLQNGTGVYIGHTESGGAIRGSYMDKRFFSVFKNNVPVGDALWSAKMRTGGKWDYFEQAHYHIFGDPTYGWHPED